MGLVPIFVLVYVSDTSRDVSGWRPNRLLTM